MFPSSKYTWFKPRPQTKTVLRSRQSLHKLSDWRIRFLNLLPLLGHVTWPPCNHGNGNRHLCCHSAAMRPRGGRAHLPVPLADWLWDKPLSGRQSNVNKGMERKQMAWRRDITSCLAAELLLLLLTTTLVNTFLLVFFKSDKTKRFLIPPPPGFKSSF